MFEVSLTVGSRPQMTLKLMRNQPHINQETVRQIVHRQLGEGFICSLTEEQSYHRDMTGDFNQICQVDPRFVGRIITENEYSVLQCDLETK